MEFTRTKASHSIIVGHYSDVVTRVVTGKAEDYAPTVVFGALPDQRTTYEVPFDFSDFRSYGVIAGYRRMLREGQTIPPTHYERATQEAYGTVELSIKPRITQDAWGAGCIYSTQTRSVPIWAVFPQVDVNLFPDLDQIDEELLLKLRSKMNNGVFQSLVFAAELAQTVGMVSHRATGLAQFLTAFAQLKNTGNPGPLLRVLRQQGITPPGKGDKPYTAKYLKQASKDSAALWLEFSFGWTPFVMDILTAYRAAAHILDHPKGGKRVVTKRQQATGERTLEAWSGVETFRCRATSTIERSTRFTASWRVSDPSLYALRQTGLTNLPSAAWEAIPFSFVADWAFSIGDWLKGLDAGVGVTFTGCTKGVYTRRTTDYGAGHSAGVNQGWDSVSVAGRLRTTNVTRIPYEDLPWVPPSAALHFDPQLGVKRAISALALLRQRVR